MPLDEGWQTVKVLMEHSHSHSLTVCVLPKQRLAAAIKTTWPTRPKPLREGLPAHPEHYHKVTYHT